MDGESDSLGSSMLGGNLKSAQVRRIAIFRYAFFYGNGSKLNEILYFFSTDMILNYKESLQIYFRVLSIICRTPFQLLQFWTKSLSSSLLTGDRNIRNVRSFVQQNLRTYYTPQNCATLFAFLNCSEKM